MELQDKKEQLKALLSRAYAPYSHFRVAALVELKDATLVPGVNIENISYGATICAERVAICNALAQGYTKEQFERLYVMCDSDELGMPCFLCRQVIVEHFNKTSEVIVMNRKGQTKTYTVAEICPYPFENEVLR